MKFWLDKGIDGFRMDVINAISKVPGLPDGEVKPGDRYASGGEFYMNGPRVHEFLQEMYEKVLSHYDIMTVGEAAGREIYGRLWRIYPLGSSFLDHLCSLLLVSPVLYHAMHHSACVLEGGTTE